MLRQFLTHDAYVTEAGWQRGVNGSGAWSHDDYNCDIQGVEMWTYMPAVPTSAKSGAEKQIAQQPQAEICIGCGEPLTLGRCTNYRCDESRDNMARSAAANL